MKHMVPQKVYLSLFLIWLFHISGIIGIALGHKEWFIPKTPLNLLVCTALFIWIYPLDSKRKWGIFGLFFFIGMFLEWLGANYSLLFGSYDYGENLGYKVDGVPLFIGINWALLTFITGELSKKAAKNIWFRATIGALLMVFLDFLMEQSAPGFDFWSFGEHVPLENYVTWFLVAFIFQIVFQKTKMEGNTNISLHLFLAQMVFFGYFMVFPV